MAREVCSLTVRGSHPPVPDLQMRGGSLCGAAVADACVLLPALATAALEALAAGTQEESSAHRAARHW